ncbi:DNA topoisomerase I [Candidatus Pacearchaeota archaeon ex4484_71]|nr:MAG: DNA topoisomerase I [Candidatus Pacearchaeota archaeon ex4484_71]
MPKKPKKSREEKTVENYFPVDTSDIKIKTEKSAPKEISREDVLKNTTEKEVKSTQINREEIVKKSVEKKYLNIGREDVEVIEKKGKKTKKTRKREKKTTTKEIRETTPKILLKKNGYELIITEKPQAASKIATALGTYSKKGERGVPYYEVDRDGKKIIVACAVGHLFTLKQNNPGSGVPIFDISWVPNFEVRKKDFTKKYYDLLKKLSKNAGEITVATDFDIEGEVIGRNVVKMICGQEDAKRMKFSTLTEKELNDAYEHKLNHIHWGQATAGETRHYLDWYYGINLSRAIMNAIKSTGKFKIMSIGRVQGPTLNLIVKREREIKAFKPEKYWNYFIILEKPEIELKYTKDIFDKKELQSFEKMIGETIEVETKKTEQEIPPNPPFNLTTLQTEAYRIFGITPSRTLKIAQSLYLAGLISYPRTSSQKLPETIDYKSILAQLKKKYSVGRLLKRKKPVEGKKTDPAHPSIYPTGQHQVLSEDDEKIYDLIVKRFLSLFCENAIVARKRISAKKDGKSFSANGSEIKRKAWLEIYPSKVSENDLPDVNGKIKIKDTRVEEKETQPPKRYSQASILSELEKRNLGTKATRASILETLYDRGYIRERSIEATPLGISLIETLEKYSPIIIDENLTKGLQDEMDEITTMDEIDLREREEKILEKARSTITKITSQFEKYEKNIGKDLMDAQTKLISMEKKKNTLCACPKCKKGNLVITYSKKTRRYFVACDAYPNCKNTYSLPPNSIFKKAGKNCESCGFPMITSFKKGKKPWTFCFNPECETNRERIEAYQKKKSESLNEA